MDEEKLNKIKQALENSTCPMAVGAIGLSQMKYARPKEQIFKIYWNALKMTQNTAHSQWPLVVHLPSHERAKAATSASARQESNWQR